MTSAKVSKRRTRERVAQMRAAEQRRNRRRKTALGSAVAVAALAGAVSLWALLGSGGAGIRGVQTFSGLARTHVTGSVNYPQSPPVGGPHSSVVLDCGIYAAPVPSVNAVHSLEHGAVWVTYRPGLPATEVNQLRALVRGESPPARGYVILSPYPDLPAPVVASAWGKQLRLTGVSDGRLPRFITTYAQGPQTPEPGSPCSGGTGTPLP